MLTEFDPVKLSIEENQFIIDHAGEAPVVALRDRPAHVTLASVRPIIEGVYEHIETAKHDPTYEWNGVEAVKDACRTYIREAAKWAANKGRRGAPRFPSMYSFDSRGRAFWSGIGSDSGQVRTYFSPTGERIPFAVSLTPNPDMGWKPDWITATPQAVETTKKGLVNNETAHRIECFCGHTESYKDGSRASYSAARARMSKHLRRDTDAFLVDDHRAVHTAEFA